MARTVTFPRPEGREGGSVGEHRLTKVCHCVFPGLKVHNVVSAGNPDSVPEAANRHLMCSEFIEIKYEPRFSQSFHQCQWICMRSGCCLDVASAC